MAEKELELYYRHVALYGDPNNRSPYLILDSPMKTSEESHRLDSLKHKSKSQDSFNGFSPTLLETESDSSGEESLGVENDLSTSESEQDSEIYMYSEIDDGDGEKQVSSSRTGDSSSAISGSSLMFENKQESSYFDCGKPDIEVKY